MTWTKGVEDLKAWVAKRLKTQDGRWITDKDVFNDGSDVIFCILCAMENRETDSEEYRYLVDTAREFLKDNPSEKEEKELEERLKEDGAQIS